MSSSYSDSDSYSNQEEFENSSSILSSTSSLELEKGSTRYSESISSRSSDYIEEMDQNTMFDQSADSREQASAAAQSLGATSTTNSRVSSELPYGTLAKPVT